eukprot:GFKZ01015570.1.p1 GENE.GFKZ01015570.1~~GFKZ01015570.1.p1  ORF type:complete len:391 (-),score=54.36 GFKZ01015570.1:126-1181(-)
MPVPKRSICIVGAGAIGGLLGVHLSQRGHRVTFFARGAHLAAMQATGRLKLVRSGATEEEEIYSADGSRFVASLRGLEAHDLVILSLKTHQIRDVVGDLGNVVGKESVILTTQNGIPWWYFQEYNGVAELRGRVVEAVDPGGVLFHAIDAGKIVASVVYPAAHIREAGVIEHVEGVRFPVGEPNGDTGSGRVKWVSEMLIDAGFKSPILADVRGELWLKLWGTVAVNPLSALTHATLDELCTVPFSRQVVMSVMREVEMVASKLGSGMRLPMERRVDGAAKVGRHKTSMLQDVEAGREMEVETIVGAVVELARMAGVDTPCVDTVYGTVRMLGYMMKKEGAKVRMIPVTDE